MIQTFVHGSSIYVATSKELTILGDMNARAVPRGELYLGGYTLSAGDFSVFISTDAVRFLFEDRQPIQSISVTDVLDAIKEAQTNAT